MDRRCSWTLRVLALAVAGASLAGCAVYPARPYGYGHGGGHGYRPYAYSAPAWGGAGAATDTAMVGDMGVAGATVAGGARSPRRCRVTTTRRPTLRGR